MRGFGLLFGAERVFNELLEIADAHLIVAAFGGELVLRVERNDGKTARVTCGQPAARNKLLHGLVQIDKAQ